MKIFSQCANCLFLNREKTSIFNECNTSFVGIFMICFTHLNLKKKSLSLDCKKILPDFPLKAYKFNFY